MSKACESFKLSHPINPSYHIINRTLSAAVDSPDASYSLALAGNLTSVGTISGISVERWIFPPLSRLVFPGLSFGKWKVPRRLVDP